MSSAFGRAQGAPLVKVCGLVHAAEVEHAASAGADLVGLVSFEPSPRHLADEHLVELAKGVANTSARSVLVTVNADRGQTDLLVARGFLDAVQLCGSEDPDDWRDAPYSVLRRLGVDQDAGEELARWARVAAAFVLDAPSSPGGTGEGVDLDLALRLAAEAPALLAGGLHGGAAALQDPRSKAFVGFDASSRLESSPGTKDPDLIRQFIQSAKRTGASPTGKPA